MEDRRHLRRAVLWHGKLRAKDQTPIDCLVFDISGGGAKVRAERLPPVQSEVDLIIDRIGVFPAKVAWQRGDRIGIKFLEEAWTVEKRIADAPVVATMAVEPAG